MLSDKTNKFQLKSVLLVFFLLRKCFLAFDLVGLSGNLTCSFRSTVKMGLVRGLSVSGCGRSQQSAKEGMIWYRQELKGNEKLKYTTAFRIKAVHSWS